MRFNVTSPTASINLVVRYGSRSTVSVCGRTVTLWRNDFDLGIRQGGFILIQFIAVALYNSPSVAGLSRCGRQTTHAIILSNTPSYNAAYTCSHTDTTMRLIYLRPTCWWCRNLTAENNASHASRTTNDRVTTATTHARTLWLVQFLLIIFS